MPLFLNSLTEPVAGLLARIGDSTLPLTRGAQADAAALTVLENTLPTELFPNARSAEGALSGLLLRLGYWEKGHGTAQDLETREGAYWHAVIHRMEPDFGNSAYWFRRVGQHPIFPPLAERAAAIIRRSPEVKFRLGSSWDPYVFNTLCQEALKQAGSSEESIAREIHTAEWELLFEWCISR